MFNLAFPWFGSRTRGWTISILWLFLLLYVKLYIKELEIKTIIYKGDINILWKGTATETLSDIYNM